MDSILLSVDTQIHMQSTDFRHTYAHMHAHTQRAKIYCSGNVASFTDVFFEKQEISSSSIPGGC